MSALFFVSSVLLIEPKEASDLYYMSTEVNSLLDDY